MAIKINGKDLQKRIISGHEVEKVMLNGVQIRPEVIPPVFDDYLWFESDSATGYYIQLAKTGNPTSVSLEYSYDKNTWVDYTIGDSLFIRAGNKVYIRNKSETPTGFSSLSNYYSFKPTSGQANYNVSCGGDVTSLICKNGSNTLSNFCFVSLFSTMSRRLVTAPKLSAMNLAMGCYLNMFAGNSSLTTPPELPATTLYDYCYSGMFSRSGITIPPSLPATNLADNCYFRMFEESGLNALPELPATNLPYYCYESMFRYCAGIKLSETQTGEYQTPYRIPSSGTGTVGSDSMTGMFYNTGGTFTGTPTINTTYYTSNTIIS